MTFDASLSRRVTRKDCAPWRKSVVQGRGRDAQAPEGSVRVATDGRGVREVAVEVVALTGWLG